MTNRSVAADREIERTRGRGNILMYFSSAAPMSSYTAHVVGEFSSADITTRR